MGAIDTLPLAEQIEAIYIGYFGRAADAGGLAYWEQYYSQLIASNHTIDQTLNIIANDFAPQNETVGLYPFLAGSITSLSTADLQILVTQIYQNLFGHNPDAGGETYWVGQLQSGSVPLGSAILDIANGATGVDTTVLADRIAVANTFSSETAAAGIGTTSVSQTFITEARDVILSIGANGVNDSVSLTEQISEADQAIAAFVANGGTLATGPGLIGGTGPGDSPLVTFTPGQDNLTGYGGDTFVAPLAGVVGAQSATLQSGDSAIEISPLSNAVLDATFNPLATGTETFGFFHFFGEDGGFFAAKTETTFGPNYVNATLEGIATWNLTGVGDVYGVGPVVLINGGPNVTGLTTVNVNNSSVGTFFVIGGDLLNPSGPNFNPLGYGTNGAQGLVTTIGASNDAGGNRDNSSGVNVIQQASLFTPTSSVQVNLANAGSGAPSTDTYSQDYVLGIDQTFTIADGPNTGKAGIVTWNIASGGVANYIYLETDGATSTTTINITGAGALTLFGDSYYGEFKNLTTINASTMTGNLTITGDLNGGNGLLSDSPLLTSVTLGSGTNFIDLSGYTLAQLDAMTIINGGTSTGNEVVLDNSVLTGAHAPIPGLTGFTIIGDAGTDGFSSGMAGTINWANLPATANELIFYGDITYSPGGLNIINTPGIFTVNFQNNDFGDNNITISDASHTSTTDALTLSLGCNLNGSDATGFHSVVTINGYATVTIDAIGVNHFATGGENSFVGFDLDSNPGSAPHVIITGMASFDFGTSFFTQGGSGPGLQGDIANAIATIGTPSVSVGPGGVITDTDTGLLTIASTDASQIDASAGGGLSMNAPDTNVGEGVTVIGSSGALGNEVGNQFSAYDHLGGTSEVPGNLLQGSLGLLTSSSTTDGANTSALADQLGVDVNYENPLSEDFQHSNVYTGAGGADNITGGDVTSLYTGSDALTAGNYIFTTGGGVGFGVSESNAATNSGFAHDSINDPFGSGVYAGGVLAITPNATTVTLQDSNDIVFYSQFAGGPIGGSSQSVDGLFAAPLAVTDNYGQFLGGGTLTINGFVPGPHGDVIDFALASFGYNEDNPITGALQAGLVNGEGDYLNASGIWNSTNPIFQNINSSGTPINDFTNVILDGIASYANAAALSAAVVNSGSFFTLPGNAMLPGHTYEMLVAYNATGGGVNIALEQFTNENGFPIHNTGVGSAVISEAVDLVHIAGITLSQLDLHNIFFS